jgi:hypothetical protein
MQCFAVVVVVGGAVVVVVGGGGGAVVGGGAGALVVAVGVGVVVPGRYTWVTAVGTVWLRCGCVVGVLGVDVDVVVDGTAVGSTVAASVFGPLAAIGATSCTLCCGNLGWPLPGESRTSTANRAPTTPRPASIPVRWDRDRGGRTGAANSS